MSDWTVRDIIAALAAGASILALARGDAVAAVVLSISASLLLHLPDD